MYVLSSGPYSAASNSVAKLSGRPSHWASDNSTDGCTKQSAEPKLCAYQLCTRSENPTHGSEWIVQIFSTRNAPRRVGEIPPTAVGGWFRSSLSSRSVDRGSKMTVLTN